MSPSPSPADLATPPAPLTGGIEDAVDAAATVEPPPGRTLLVWDAPNIDMSLGSLLGTRPTSAFRPRFDAVGRWLLSEAGPEGIAEATVFTNVVPGSTEIVRPWVEALRNVGFAVFAKPKTAEDSDVDEDMLAHIELRRNEGGLSHVVVASGDGRAFREPLEELVAEGITVTVIGFREYAAFAVASEIVDFLDLEDIEGVFREPLPRVSLDTLPDAGAWLPPLRSLRSLLER
ncbi:NYN domain-containing protein [Actinomycetospora lemnae]|uniref:NYN domain-containing protein n=1 Tax=Actinomycetospora lemnae TaxID=3019891 RepID=A0ABT5SS04_9PSEU|nr:NYN domain-containing protein [Actinomycetospora sp. DW7H6]MDD7965620.1 NYN domain-containing protein [Actinomycetospora sp. DW7H6]